MKNSIALIVLALAFGTQALASADRDGTPTRKVARQLAFAHAANNVFTEILDHDSSISTTLLNSNPATYIFKVSAENCSVEISVSKETGLAWNEEEMVCK